MSDTGYILLHRKIDKDCEIFNSTEPFCPRSAWIYLISKAFFKTTEITFNKQTFTLNRGQFITTLNFLARRWNWKSDKKVRLYIERLIGSLKIGKQGTSVGTIITILNYDKYQFNPQLLGQTENEQRTSAYKRKKESKSLNNLSLGIQNITVLKYSIKPTEQMREIFLQNLEKTNLKFDNIWKKFDTYYADDPEIQDPPVLKRAWRAWCDKEKTKFDKLPIEPNYKNTPEVDMMIIASEADQILKTRGINTFNSFCRLKNIPQDRIDFILRKNNMHNIQNIGQNDA